MHKAALDLFLAECTATALKSEIELRGTLASALQVRHKIRDTDLQALFKLADGAQPRTFKRIYYVLTLQLFAGSAYKDLWPIFNAASGNLSLTQVTPHWDPQKTHKLGSIYAAEPMNLFAGWSLTNTRNNQTMLDPHVLMEHLDGSISSDLNGVSASGSTAPTVGMRISGALSRPDAQATTQRLGGGTPQGLKRRYSAYSLNLIDNETRMKATMGKLSGGHARDYDRQQALRKFEKLLQDMRSSTRAGIDHYRQLYQNVPQDSAISGHLVDAYKSWHAHRLTAAGDIESFCNELKNPGLNGPIMTLPHTASRPVPQPVYQPPPQHFQPQQPVYQPPPQYFQPQQPVYQPPPQHFQPQQPVYQPPPQYFQPQQPVYQPPPQHQHPQPYGQQPPPQAFQLPPWSFLKK
ncbi:MAG TPA: hypothetical protein VF555_09480 [Variovorax sp.]